MAIIRSQKTNYDCGPTCFSNTLNILGYNVTIKQANKLCSLTKDGTDSDNLLKAFDRYGFDGREKVQYSAKNAWNWLIKITNSGVPTIISTDDDTHWLLVLLAGKNKAQIYDPSELSPEIIDKKDLLKRWEYICGPKKRTRYHALELFPYKDKSIKAVIMREKLITVMDL